MGKSVGSLQFGDMVYQPELADILAIDGIVPSLKGDAVIPDRSVSFYRLMQITIAVIGIQFELVGFHGIWLSGFHVLFRRLWEAPPCGGAESPHESREYYTMFCLQIKPFFDELTRLG